MYDLYNLVMYFIVLDFHHDISDSFLGDKKSLWSTLTQNIYIFFLPRVCTAYKLDCKCENYMLSLTAFWPQSFLTHWLFLLSIWRSRMLHALAFYLQYARSTSHVHVGVCFSRMAHQFTQWIRDNTKSTFWK